MEESKEGKEKRKASASEVYINVLNKQIEFCENNPEYVRANFSEESMVDSYLKLYNEMLSEFSKT